MNIRWITLLFHFEPGIAHIGVSKKAKGKLEQMGADISGTDHTVAIYIPEGTEGAYQVGNMKGRIVGLTQLLPIPSDKTTEDYFYHDHDGSLRWPYGWPCKAVLTPSIEDCCYLRTVVDEAHGSNSFVA